MGITLQILSASILIKVPWALGAEVAKTRAAQGLCFEDLGHRKASPLEAWG